MGRTHHHSISPVPTPNTLSVQVPHVKAVSSQGQSLPNLLSIAVPVPVNPVSGSTSAMGKCHAFVMFRFKWDGTKTFLALFGRTLPD